MGNTAKNDKRKLEAADKARRAAEMRIEGKSFQAIADELGYADRSGARRIVEAYRQELPRAAIEELRDELLERAEANYARAITAVAKITDPKEKIDASAKIATILEKHARVGHVIQEAPPAIVTVTQTNAGFDSSVYTPDELAAFLKLWGKQKKGDEAKAPATEQCLMCAGNGPPLVGCAGCGGSGRVAVKS